MKAVLFFYCPYAGNNRILNNLDIIIKKYQEAGYNIIPYRIITGVDIDNILLTCPFKPDHILTAGGDGTINTIVNSMMRCGMGDIPLAPLPAGTANDFAFVLGYPANISVACDLIINGNISDIDLGVVNERYFINVLSAGLLTDVSQKTPTALKNTFGKTAYYMSSLQELPKFKKINIKIDSQELKFDDQMLMFFVFNGRTAGNMHIAYNSDISDGLFDVLIIKGDNIIDMMTTVLHFASGLETSYPKGVIYFKTGCLRIDSKLPLTVDIDGEQGPETPINIRCIKGGLKVITPKEYFRQPRIKLPFAKL